MTAAAQDGAALALLYRAQGPRQQGDSLVLLYGGSVEPLRKRIATGFGLPWGAAAVQDVPQRAPFAITTPANVPARAPWGSGRSAQHNTRPVWDVADRQDRDKRAPWGAYARRSARAATAPWGVATRRDEQAAAPWGTYTRRVAVQPGIFWIIARPQDAQATAPWGTYARRPALHTVTAWHTGRPADASRYLPWVRYSRALAPGWGVVVPGGEIPVDENGTVIVPIRSVYVTVNTLTLTRASDGALIPTLSMSMSLDVDSWTWSFSASVPGYALADIEPEDGVPVAVQAAINGVPYRFVVESIARERTFGRSDLRIGGRGRAAVLDAPYAPIMSFSNEFGRTAQQIMNDILTDNGVPLGWDVEWNPDDWNVPAGVFSHQGSYISAMNQVAGSISAYLQPHNTDEVLRVLSRYPVAPWDWAGVTPDFELPSAVMSRESIEWRDKPRYNRVYIMGQQTGVNGRVTREGTAGDYLAPSVVDPLITEAVAARQRGIAVLSDTGRIATVGLRLPVLAETGIIAPGSFISYIDGGIERIGLTRSVQVEVGLPAIWQTLGVETHVEPV